MCRLVLVVMLLLRGGVVGCKWLLSLVRVIAVSRDSRGSLFVHADVKSAKMSSHSGDVIQQDRQFPAKLIKAWPLQKLDNLENNRCSMRSEMISSCMGSVLIAHRVTEHNNMQRF